MLNERQRARLDVAICKNVWTFGDADHFSDVTVCKRDSCGGYRVETKGKVEFAEHVDYWARRAVRDRMAFGIAGNSLSESSRAGMIALTVCGRVSLYTSQLNSQ